MSCQTLTMVTDHIINHYSDETIYWVDQYVVMVIWQITIGVVLQTQPE